MELQHILMNSSRVWFHVPFYYGRPLVDTIFWASPVSIDFTGSHRWQKLDPDWLRICLGRRSCDLIGRPPRVLGGVWFCTAACERARRSRWQHELAASGRKKIDLRRTKTALSRILDRRFTPSSSRGGSVNIYVSRSSESVVASVSSGLIMNLDRCVNRLISSCALFWR